MSNNIKIEYITNQLVSVYETGFSYVPHVGDKVRVDGNCFKVTEIEPFFYNEKCKQNKIRVYLEPLKEN